MARVPRYSESVSPDIKLPGLDTRTGAEETFAAIASATSSLSGRLGQMADKAAAKEGEAEGFTAGLDREFRPSREMTIRGEARDRAGIQAFMEVTEAEQRAVLDGLSVKHKGDPNGLAQAIDATLAEQLDKLDPDGSFPEVRAAVTGLYSRSRTTQVREALREAEADRRDRNRAALEAGVRERVNAIGRAAYVNGLDPEADAVLAGEIGGLRNTVAAAVADGAISASSGGQVLADIEEDAALNRVMGTFDRLEGPQAKTEFLAQVQADYAGGQGPMAKFSPEKFRTLQRSIETAIERDRAEAVRFSKELDRGWSAMEAAAANGTPPGADALARQRALAEATGDEATIARAAAGQQRIAFARDLQTRRPAELEAMSRMLQQKASREGLSEAEADRLDTIGKVQTAQNRMLQSDPYQWGLRAGALKEDVALTWDGGAGTAKTLAARRDAWHAMRERYGDVPFFTAAEKSALTYISSQGGEQMQAVAAAMVATLGPEDGPAALAEVSKEAPVLANLAGLQLAGGNRDLAGEASQALALRRDPAYRPPKFREDQMRIAAGDMMGTAYLADPHAGAAVRETARLLFEKRALDRGIANFDFNENPEAAELWQRSLDEAAGASWPGGVKHGGIASVNGSSIIAPPDMAADRIEQMVRSISDDDLKALPPIRSANSKAVSERQIQGAKLVSVGDGLYRVALGDPTSEDPRYLAQANGDFWELDIRRLARLQGSRTLDAVRTNMEPWQRERVQDLRQQYLKALQLDNGGK